MNDFAVMLDLKMLLNYRVTANSIVEAATTVKQIIHEMSKEKLIELVTEQISNRLDLMDNNELLKAVDVAQLTETNRTILYSRFLY